MSKTLFDKVWDSHVVRKIEQGPDVLFIDRHLIHEVTSPVAFLGLKQRGISVLYPERTFATADHNTPTIDQHLPVSDPLRKSIRDPRIKCQGTWYSSLGIRSREQRYCTRCRTRKWYYFWSNHYVTTPYSRCFWGHCIWYWYLRGRWFFLPNLLCSQNPKPCVSM